MNATFDFARKTLRLIAGGPDTQIDPAWADELKALADKPEITADDLIDELDRGVHASLGSEFVITCLDVLWKSLGGDNAQAQRRHKQRARESSSTEDGE